LFEGLIKDLEEWKQMDAESVNGCWICEPDAFSSQQHLWNEVDEDNSEYNGTKVSDSGENGWK